MAVLRSSRKVSRVLVWCLSPVAVLMRCGRSLPTSPGPAAPCVDLGLGRSIGWPSAQPRVGDHGCMSDRLQDQRPVRRVQRQQGISYDPQQWPYRMAPVAQLLEEGLDLPAGVTFLVGENGSGKSTLLEAIAAAAGLNPEGGSRHAQHATRVSESPLAQALQLIRTPGAARWSYFLRAETMHGLYTYLEELPAGPRQPPRTRLHELSHGESFIEVLAEHFHEPGFYVLDEPEAALSFTSCLALVGVLHSLAGNGGLVLCATHSPLLTALPGATILQLGDTGYAPVQWQDLHLVDHWRRYLNEPQSYLRHILD